VYGPADYGKLRAAAVAAGATPVGGAAAGGAPGPLPVEDALRRFGTGHLWSLA
jgi:hypothetical protein